MGVAVQEQLVISTERANRVNESWGLREWGAPVKVRDHKERGLDRARMAKVK
jgi:hypothetical protein